MAELKEFLAELAINPQKLGEFIHDPEAAMTAASLSDEDRAALRSRFPNAIYARLVGVPIQQAFQFVSPSAMEVPPNVAASQILPTYQINIFLPSPLPNMWRPSYIEPPPWMPIIPGLIMPPK